MIQKETIDRILDTVRIEDVIGDFIALKRRGANYIACCPFHNEKTPSFSVSPVKGIYKCFGCGKAGNAVSFVMEHEHLSYSEALKYIANKYNIEVVENEESAEDAQKRLYNESLLIVNEYAQNFFVKQLFETQEGQAVGLSYFKERGFTDETIKYFGLGYAPNDKAVLTKTALKAGYKKEHLVGVGLTVERDNGDLMDRYYERVIFPIRGLSGKVIAFGGRKLRGDKNIAKYINSPESPVYIKNRVLYGIYEAKAEIAREQKCYLVEGYTDVISFHQSGIRNVVASSGTSLTTGQILLIKRFTNNVTVLYDGDFAGIKASLRGIDMLLAEGLQVKVALFPDGEDPDSFAKSHTPDELREFLHSSEVDFISFKQQVLLDDAGKDPIKRAAMINDIVGSISVIPDPITRNIYVNLTAKEMNISEDILQVQIGRLRRKRQENEYLLRKRDEERKQISNSDNSYSNSANGYSNDTNDRDNSANSHSSGDNNGGMDDVGGGSIEGGNPSGDAGLNLYRDQGNSVEPLEKELLYYLLNFGKEKLYINPGTLNQENGSVPTVAQYIKNELITDELEFQNRLYKQIFESYFELSENYQSNNDVVNYFARHSNNEICQAIVDITTLPHVLTIKAFQKSMIKEENVLGIYVPKCVLIYKARVTTQMVSILTEELKTASDDMRVVEIMNKLNMLNQVRRVFAKELNRITI